MNKTCTRCGEARPSTGEFFGHTPLGGLKGFCRDCERKASRAYEAQNKDRRRARDAKRAEAGGGVRGSFTLKLKRRELFQKQGGRCPCCFKLIDRFEAAEVDHSVPLSRGQRRSSNRFLVHKQCNKEKHNKTFAEHWEWRVKDRRRR
jgi:5-methylcytosine-specific restriction endonuclease McrA